MNLQKEKRRKRERRHLRVRQKVYGTKERPRLAVYKSLKNIYCQLIDDIEGKTLVSASTLSPGIKEQVPYGGNKKAAEVVGQKVAEEAKKLGIEKVVFDRSWYKFHGRVKALADAARKGNLRF